MQFLLMIWPLLNPSVPLLTRSSKSLIPGHSGKLEKENISILSSGAVLGMYGQPWHPASPPGAIILPPHWNYRVKSNGTQCSCCKCCDTPLPCCPTFRKMTPPPILRCPYFVFKLHWPFLVTPLCIESKCPSKEGLILRLKFLGHPLSAMPLSIAPCLLVEYTLENCFDSTYININYICQDTRHCSLSLPFRSPLLDPGLVPLLQSAPISHFYSFSILIVVFDIIQLGS